MRADISASSPAPPPKPSSLVARQHSSHIHYRLATGLALTLLFIFDISKVISTACRILADQ